MEHFYYSRKEELAHINADLTKRVSLAIGLNVGAATLAYVGVAYLTRMESPKEDGGTKTSRASLETVMDGYAWACMRGMTEYRAFPNYQTISHFETVAYIQGVYHGVPRHRRVIVLDDFEFYGHKERIVNYIL